MAEAKVEYSDVVVTLKLSDDEAQFLADILNRIGGSPYASRRKYADSIKNALADVDFRGSASDYNDDIESENRAIYFEDLPL